MSKYVVDTSNPLGFDNAIKNFQKDDVIEANVSLKDEPPMVHYTSNNYYALSKYLLIVRESGGISSQIYPLFTKNKKEVCGRLKIDPSKYYSFENALAANNCSVIERPDDDNQTYLHHRIADKIICPQCTTYQEAADCLILDDSSEENANFIKEVNTLYGENAKYVLLTLSSTMDIAKKDETKKENLYCCQDCGSVFSIKDCYVLAYGCDYHFIPKKVFFRHTNNNKLSIKFYGCFYGWYDDGEKDISIPVFVKATGGLCFNLENGHSYIIPLKTSKGKMISRRHIANMHHVTNITYGKTSWRCANATVASLFTENKDMWNLTCKVLSKSISLGEAIDPTNPIFTNKNQNNWGAFLTLKNRFPMLPAKTIGALMDIDFYKVDKFFKKIERNWDYNKALEYAYNYSQFADSTKAKELISADIGNAFVFKVINDFGIKNEENAIEFLPVIKRYIGYQKNDYSSFNIKNLAIFSKEIIKILGSTLDAEKYIISMLKKSQKRFWSLEESVTTFIEIMNSSLKDDLKHLALYLSDDASVLCPLLKSIYKKVEFENKKIPYKKKDVSSFNNLVGEYDFRLVNDTNELVRVGQILGVSIGSYRPQVLEKSELVVIAYDYKTRIPQFYITINSKTKTVSEIKTSLNKRIMNDAACAFLDWLDCLELNIDLTNCLDYNHISMGNFMGKDTYSGRDSHQLELDENGNVIRI